MTQVLSQFFPHLIAPTNVTGQFYDEIAKAPSTKVSGLKQNGGDLCVVDCRAGLALLLGRGHVGGVALRIGSNNIDPTRRQAFAIPMDPLSQGARRFVVLTRESHANPPSTDTGVVNATPISGAYLYAYGDRGAATLTESAAPKPVSFSAETLQRIGPTLQGYTIYSPEGPVPGSVNQAYLDFLMAVTSGYALRVHQDRLDDPTVVNLAIPGDTDHIKPDRVFFQPQNSKREPVGSSYEFDLKKGTPEEGVIGATVYSVANGTRANKTQWDTTNNGGFLSVTAEFSVGPATVTVTVGVPAAALKDPFGKWSGTQLDNPSVTITANQAPLVAKQLPDVAAPIFTTLPLPGTSGTPNASSGLPRTVAGFDTPFFKEMWTTLVPTNFGDDGAFAEVVKQIDQYGITREMLPDYFAQFAPYITSDREKWKTLIDDLHGYSGLEMTTPFLFSGLHEKLASFIKEVAGAQIEARFPGVLNEYIAFQKTKEAEDKQTFYFKEPQGTAIFAALLAYYIDSGNKTTLQALQEELEDLHSALDPTPGVPMTWIMEFIRSKCAS